MILNNSCNFCSLDTALYAERNLIYNEIIDRITFNYTGKSTIYSEQDRIETAKNQTGIQIDSVNLNLRSEEFVVKMYENSM